MSTQEKDWIKIAQDPASMFHELEDVFDKAQGNGALSEELCRQILLNPNVVLDEGHTLFLHLIRKIAGFYPDLVALESTHFALFAMLEGDRRFIRIARLIVERSRDYNIALAITKVYKEDVSLRCGLLRRSDTPSDVLVDFVTNPSSSIRSCVARSENAPQQILEELSKDPDEFVVAVVAGNPATPPSVLEVLCASSSSEVRDSVAKNESTPIHCLIKLSKDKIGHVVVAVARNPKTPKELLESLWDHPNSEVLTALCDNPSSPPELLKRLFRYSTYLMREDLASNPSTPEDILRKLARDDDKSTRIKAESNLASRGLMI